MILYPHFDTNAAGHLTVGGMDAVALAREFGTPAYILDEDVIRQNCRTYLSAAKAHFGENALPLYASKALSFTGIYRIVAEEGLGIDCVSGGELYTAKNADFPAERIYFHGNNKTDADLRQALEMGVGTIVVDGMEELEALDALARELGKTQKILLRITPGIDPHTHRAIMTGNVDSKFGNAIVTGQALAITKKALSLGGVALAGFHCHIGSQIFDIEPFRDAADIMLKFIADIKTETGFEATELNLGGGLGVRYTEDDRGIDYADAIARIAEIVRTESFCAAEKELAELYSRAAKNGVPVVASTVRILLQYTMTDPNGFLDPRRLAELLAEYRVTLSFADIRTMRALICAWMMIHVKDCAMTDLIASELRAIPALPTTEKGKAETARDILSYLTEHDRVRLRSVIYRTEGARQVLDTVLQL